MLDDVEERYSKVAASARQFLITQLGVSAFVWVPPHGGSEGHWEARSFNITVFPRPYDDYDQRCAGAGRGVEGCWEAALVGAFYLLTNG